MGTVDSAGREARRTARQAAKSRTLDRFARFGMVCRGLMYGLIGVLALQVAFGVGGREADESGAIGAVAARPFGEVVLWLMLVGFAAMAVWQLTVAVMGSEKAHDRVEAAGRTVFYGFLVVTLGSLLLAGHGPEPGDQASRDLTARMLGIPGGQLLVGGIGIGVLAAGAVWLYKGVTRGFLEELHTWQIPSGVQAGVETVGLIGYVARGAVATLAGIFLVQAAMRYAPNQAKGVDATLRAFADTPFGPWLLAAVAAGLLCFAAYCLCEAGWRRV